MLNNFIFKMYNHSDFLVQMIVVGLLAVSVIIWSLFFNRCLFLIRFKSSLRHDLFILKKTSNLENLIAQLVSQRYFLNRSLIYLLEEIVTELYLSWYSCSCNISVDKRVMLRLKSALINIRDYVEQGDIFIVTVVSVAPFVGLFGTVWGVIRCFIGMQVVNFSLMISGVSEALILTGFGLLVAIPGVIMRNIILRCIIVYENMLDDCVRCLLLLVKRDLDVKKKIVSEQILIKAYHTRKYVVF